MVYVDRSCVLEILSDQSRTRMVLETRLVNAHCNTHLN